jgi:hypothetical protein
MEQVKQDWEEKEARIRLVFGEPEDMLQAI